MAMEKRWKAVLPQAFTADGTIDGKILIANTRLFKVKQKVILTAGALPHLELEVKHIDNGVTMYVGPMKGNIDSRTDISAYTIALSAAIFANEQPRSSVPQQEIERLTYEEEPTVARRVILVDSLGDKYDLSNPLPVTVDTTVNIGDVHISAQDNDPYPGNVHSSIRISDGIDDLQVNNDGSINVNVVSSPSSSPGLNVAHNEVTSIAAGIETTLITMVGPVLGSKIYKIEVSGENIAIFKVKINAVVIASKRTFLGGSLNETFAFEPFENGFELFSGDILIVTALHQRPSLANFEATIHSINL